jgi:hypothetical protein
MQEGRKKRGRLGDWEIGGLGDWGIGGLGDWEREFGRGWNEEGRK